MINTIHFINLHHNLKHVNIAHSAKLEIYQIILKPRRGEDKTFRDFISEKLELDPTIDETDMFYRFAEHFLNSIDTAEFIGDERKKKADRQGCLY